MKKHLLIGLISCVITFFFVSGSFAGALLQTEEQTVQTHELLIITPEKFSQTLQPLVEHKEQMGISTQLVTLETILYHPETTQGRDDAEKMKYYIKYAIEEYDISYVFLVGGKKGQIGSWHLPVRYVHMDNNWETHYVSDLYFADIYTQEGQFSTWDSDQDGTYGEWKDGMPPEDKDIDLYPDIALGRIPCRNNDEVNTVVEKIIYYEKETKNISRFNTFLTLAGDTYLECDDPLWKGNEGEEFAEESMQIMSDFTPTRMFLSENGFSGPEDVIPEFNKGYGFVYFVGHGSPKSWGTHKPNDKPFIDGLNTNDMKKLQNDELFPVCVVSGCHNCQFDVGLNKLLLGFLDHGLNFITDNLIFRFEWIPEGWGWLMTNQEHGGSIVTYGTTALGHTREDKDSFTGGINEFEIQLFKQYKTHHVHHAGDILKESLHWYLDTYPINWSVTNETKLGDTWVDVQVCQSYMLMGDPSLLIGGY
jgi:hypothetical protein